MPEISRFLGIVIAMYYRDHAPPHFHAIYGDFEVTVEIASGRVNGDFPKRRWRTYSNGVACTEKNSWTLGPWLAPAARFHESNLWSNQHVAACH